MSVVRPEEAARRGEAATDAARADAVYEEATRQAYRDPDRAERYRLQYVAGWKWARFTMWREARLIERCLRSLGLAAADTVLDAPCGAGMAGRALGSLPSRTVALDIAREMMALAGPEYPAERFDGFVQADVTRLPFRQGAFAGAVVIGFMHRVPRPIKLATLAELRRVCDRFVLASFTHDSRIQRLKRRLLHRFRPAYGSAPAPESAEGIRALLAASGFHVRRTFHVAPLLSGDVLYLLEPSRESEPTTASRERTA